MVEELISTPVTFLTPNCKAIARSMPPPTPIAMLSPPVTPRAASATWPAAALAPFKKDIDSRSPSHSMNKVGAEPSWKMPRMFLVGMSGGKAPPMVGCVTRGSVMSMRASGFQTVRATGIDLGIMASSFEGASGGSKSPARAPGRIQISVATERPMPTAPRIRMRGSGRARAKHAAARPAPAPKAISAPGPVRRSIKSTARIAPRPAPTRSKK